MASMDHWALKRLYQLAMFFFSRKHIASYFQCFFNTNLYSNNYSLVGETIMVVTESLGLLLQSWTVWGQTCHMFTLDYT